MFTALMNHLDQYSFSVILVELLQVQSIFQKPSISFHFREEDEEEAEKDEADTRTPKQRELEEMLLTS